MVEINSELEDHIHVITVSGDVDASSSILLDEEINQSMEGGRKKILFNCQGLNYISSAGLGVFMSYLQAFEANGVKVAIYGLSDKVMNVFQILGLDQLLKIVPSKVEAKEFVDEI